MASLLSFTVYSDQVVILIVSLSSVFHVGKTMFIVLSTSYSITDRSHVGMTCLIQLNYKRVGLRNIECNGYIEKLGPYITGHVKEQLLCYVKTLTKG